MRDAIGPILVVTLVATVIIWAVWYNNRFPCIQYQAVYVEQWTELQQQSHYCGDNCHYTIVIPVVHPAHWDQRCMQRGDKKLGDRPAAYAPIPAEREK